MKKKAITKRNYARWGLVLSLLAATSVGRAEESTPLEETVDAPAAITVAPEEPLPLVAKEPIVTVQAEPFAENGGSLDLRWNQHRETGLLPGERERFSTGKVDFSHLSLDGRWLFESGAVYEEYAKTPWVRDQTRVSYLNRDKGWVATAGDFATSFRGFQNSFMVAGLSFKKGDSVENDRTVFRRSAYELVLSGPMTFEIFLGHQLFVQGRRDTGILDLRSFALLRNQKDVVVRVTDQFGREDVFHFDLFAENRVLKRIEQDYFYQVGYLSKDVPGDRAYHGRSVMSAFSHRYGLNERLTIGLNYQNYEYRHLGGFDLATLQEAGLFTLDWAGTDVSGSQGFGVRLGWKDQFQEGKIGANLVYEERTEFFLPFRQEGLVMEHFRRSVDAIVTRSVSEWNVFGLGASYREGFLTIPSSRILRGDWAHFLRTNLSLEGTVYQQQGNRPEHGGRISLTWFESPRATSVSIFHDSGDQTTNLHLDRPLRGDVRDGMVRVNARRTPGSGDEVDARAGLQNRSARLRIHSFEDRAIGSRSSASLLGVDSSLTWNSEGWGVQALPP
ncbi:MAG: hypothetical protein KF789_04805 [Bdellovibrionaceae bacterium]|nr:hypothetical protein [Pseudobdellovibrionaceae bacterium]